MATPRLSRLSDFQLADRTAMKAMIDEIATEVEEHFDDIQQQITDITAAQADITAMFDDNILTPVEKPVWVFMHSFLTGEQAGLDSQATSYSITTEKTNYDNAISALTTHLGTLTTPVAWNNFTGDTNITGTTFRTKFTDVLTTKQALINKIAANAKVLADNAQSSANTAQTQANTATTNAATADAKAVAAAREAARINSYPVPTNVLTATDAGTTATITIANHTRYYPVQGTYDVPDVSITGASITGLAFSTTYYVYYDDTTLADTTPSFVATTSANTAQVGFAAGRHLVGKITTPADGGGGTSGGGMLPPGGGGGTAIP